MEKDAIRVVIVDDEPISRMDLKELPTEGGYMVVAEVSDGSDAMENCKLYHPDLVLLDIKMPFLDRLATAKTIYEEELADTIIMFTAYSEREFVEQAKDYGISDYLIKPIDEESLVPNIELVVAQSKEMKRLRKDMAKASERLANRSIIEKAKGQVMQEQNLSGQEAYHYIHKLSQPKGLSTRRVAGMILMKGGGWQVDMIWSLCRKYTDLSNEEIRIIEHMLETLQPLANLEGADILIDCSGRDGSAIVVAEAKPECVPLSYKNMVAGLLAKPENEPAVVRTFRLGVGTKQIKAVIQGNGSTVQSIESIRNGSHIIDVLILEKRVDEQRQVSEWIHSSQQSFETIAHALAQMVLENNWLTEYIDEAPLMIDRSGIVTFRNSLAQDLYWRLSYTEDILGQPYENVRLVEQDGNSEECSGYSYVETTASNLVLDIKHIQLNSAGAAFTVIIQDVTQRREQEQALTLKSMATKEIHHRVKNNLQTIASLLRLQTRRTDGEKTWQVLGENMNRILSIASTHELLAQSDVDEIMLGEVILNIKNNIMRYFSNPKRYVATIMEGGDFQVNSDITTSVAIITNELLQNSLKYAFQDRSSGEIRIAVKQGELCSSTQVSDNGSGFSVANTGGNRLGLSIVQTLVKDKLRDNLEIELSPEGIYARFDSKNQITGTADATQRRLEQTSDGVRIQRDSLYPNSVLHQALRKRTKQAA